MPLPQVQCKGHCNKGASGMTLHQVQCKGQSNKGGAVV